ncbi:ubiquitin carboxyl-terminal hydrolase 36-like [Contarinia nasturtii]|uniref:ubiquitin carboxyl-terminal hydrolase 36-like n=1 Tax=Contarinia nasturtii TaxID=265458 RepID=UPI0012D405DF|nr:ubiquitin carboxyl-terminal hydrolase 36-like [Contarinia nasturtii]
MENWTLRTILDQLAVTTATNGYNRKSKTPFETVQYAIITAELRRVDSIGYGLINIDNNKCYINAKLQALFYLKTFINAIKADVVNHVPECDCFVCIVHRIYLATRKAPQNVTKACKPKQLVKRIKDIFYRQNNFDSNKQQDAHEFLINLNMAMQRTYTAKPTTLHVNPKANGIYLGSFYTTIECPQTQYEKTFNTHDFGILSLNINDENINSVHEALDVYFEPNKLENTCTICNRDKYKTDQIGTAPEVIVLHLKRFEVDGSGKMTKNIAINDQLDLTKYATPTCIDIFPSLRYRLISMVCHKGNDLDHGHYVTLVSKNSGNDDDPTNKSFYLFNDKQLSLIKNTERIVRDAYVLFYERIECTNDGQTQAIPSNVNQVPLNAPNANPQPSTSTSAVAAA